MSNNYTVIVRNNDVERAIKKMKTKANKLGIIKSFKENAVYEKPSDKRVRKMKEYIINSKIKKRKREKDL